MDTYLLDSPNIFPPRIAVGKVFEWTTPNNLAHLTQDLEIFLTSTRSANFICYYYILSVDEEINTAELGHDMYILSKKNCCEILMISNYKGNGLKAIEFFFIKEMCQVVPSSIFAIYPHNQK